MVGREEQGHEQPDPGRRAGIARAPQRYADEREHEGDGDERLVSHRDDEAERAARPADAAAAGGVRDAGEEQRKEDDAEDEEPDPDPGCDRKALPVEITRTDEHRG